MSYMNETGRYSRDVSYKYQEESRLKVICNVEVLKWVLNLENKYLVSPTYESLGVEKFDSVSISQSLYVALKAMIFSRRYKEVWVTSFLPLIFHWCDIC